MAAWIATMGDDPHAPAFRTLLEHHDAAVGEAERWRSQVGRLAEARLTAEARAAVARVDADRLARWIIEHPTSADPTEVLNLHDRAMA